MISPKFLKSEVVEEFGGVSTLAQFFNIQTQAISQWAEDKPIPVRRQLEIRIYRPDLCAVA